MRNIPTLHDAGPDNLHQMPSWVTAARAETVEDAAFRSGAALTYVGLAVRNDAVPQALWRARLALAAATACLALSGRRDSAADLRDALHLTRSGDDPGPAGRVLRQWTQAVARPISVAGLGRALEGVTPARIALCLDATGPTPVDRAAQGIETVLEGTPRAETAALILADAVLSKALGQDHVPPLLSLALKTRDQTPYVSRPCYRYPVTAPGQDRRRGWIQR
ncbi:MAG: DUF1403 family protein [Pseudotabrizicola sp.]|uniref:DUF1403 family protein n=1 Tax=Pseudotabrizicola sp. TaxID=2939647 RepID=UPI002724D810|nr:DUF1403 family protein [Pseudotabrizicola sp.]MDO9640798.1 DUF1403 family protein [Pseudotabrizicola sp.]